MVLSVIARRQLEHRLAAAFREPHDGALDHRGRPVDTALQHPGCLDPGQLGGGGQVEVDGDAGVALQERRGDVGGDFPFDRTRDDRRLVFAGRQQGDLPGVENRGNAHRDRLARDVFDAEEIGRGVLARQGVERDDAGPRRRIGPGLVETDVPRLADAEELEVDAACRPNRLVVRGAGLDHALARDGAVGDMHVLLRDVHMREEVLPHVAAVAVGTVGRHRVVLVEVERDDARKIDVAGLMAPDQLFVDAEGSAPRSEPQDRSTFGAGLALNDLDDPFGDREGEVRVLGKDDGAESLALARALDREGCGAAGGGLRHLHLHFDGRPTLVPHVQPRHRDDQHARRNDRV